MVLVERVKVPCISTSEWLLYNLCKWCISLHSTLKQDLVNVSPIAEMNFNFNLCIVCTPFIAMQWLEPGLVEEEVL